MSLTALLTPPPWPLVDVEAPTAPAAPAGAPRRAGSASRRARRAAAALLREQELAAARRAELHHMAAVLGDAAALVARGWVQDGWLQVRTGSGPRTITSRALHLVDDQAVTGACLVGAVVHGAGLSHLSSQLTQRSLDVVWESVFDDRVRPGRACAPEVHRARVRDLTRLNDDPGRRREDVVRALHRARGHVREASATTR